MFRSSSYLIFNKSGFHSTLNWPSQIHEFAGLGPKIEIFQAVFLISIVWHKQPYKEICIKYPQTRQHWRGIPIQCCHYFIDLDSSKVMGQKTALGSLLKRIGNSGQGKVVPGWGATPVMAFVGAMLIVFLVIMLNIYNQSVLLQGFSVDWNGV